MFIYISDMYYNIINSIAYLHCTPPFGVDYCRLLRNLPVGGLSAAPGLLCGWSLARARGIFLSGSLGSGRVITVLFGGDTATSASV